MDLGRHVPRLSDSFRGDFLEDGMVTGHDVDRANFLEVLDRVFFLEVGHDLDLNLLEVGHNLNL